MREYIELMLSQDINKEGDEGRKERIKDELLCMIENLSEELGDVQEALYLPVYQVMQELIIKQIKSLCD